jgi:2-keto-3-deoxy-L-rhamnonate aldolase RhmA
MKGCRRFALLVDADDQVVLDIETRKGVEEISSVLDEHNAQIETVRLGNADQSQVTQTSLDSIARLGELAAALQAVVARGVRAGK